MNCFTFSRSSALFRINLYSIFLQFLEGSLLKFESREPMCFKVKIFEAFFDQERQKRFKSVFVSRHFVSLDKVQKCTYFAFKYS